MVKQTHKMQIYSRLLQQAGANLVPNYLQLMKQVTCNLDSI